MKKIYASVMMVACMCVSVSKAQTIFSENFNAVTPPALPTGWTEYNGDGLTVASNLSALNFGTHAWVSNNPTFGQGNNCVLSTSWYTSAAASNDWLISPAITIPASGYYLAWKAIAPDQSFADGYVVKISTTTNATASFTTTLYTNTGELGAWTGHSIDLSTYTGQTIYVAWINNSNDKFLLGVDDVKVYLPPATDMGVTAFGFTNSYVPLSSSVAITGTITNFGSNPVTNFTLNYSVDGGAPVSGAITGVNITPVTGTYTFTHPTNWVPSAPGVHTVRVYATLINGSADLNNANDTMSSTAFLYNASPQTHKLVFEEATGCWCGWCPRGAVFLDSMGIVHPNNTVLIAVHDNDPMAVTAYDAGVSAMVGGYPTILADRKYQGDPSTIFTMYSAHIGDYGLADITLTKDFNATSRVCSVTVAVKPAVSTDGTWDYRLTCVFTENQVHNTSSTYDQHNYYAGGASGTLHGAGHNWETETDPIPAANMYFDYVARNFDGDMSGTAGSLPTTMTAGTTYNYVFTYTIPADQIETNMRANVLLMDNTNGIILNGNWIEVMPNAVSDPVSGKFEASVYPNPAREQLNMSINLSSAVQATLVVTDVLGNTVAIRDLGTVPAGQNVLPVDTRNLTPGMYFVTFKTNSGSVTKTFAK